MTPPRSAPRDRSERMAAAARDMATQPDLTSTLQAAVELAVRNIEGCDDAGISFLQPGHHLETPAATSDDVARADQLQYDTNQGPCLDSMREHDVVHVADLTVDERWPQWGPQVVEQTGLRSTLSVRIFTTDRMVGALNMYSTRIAPFTVADRDEGIALAAHVAVAVEGSREIHGLRAALDSRTLIGQATGIAMERYDLTATQAWNLLTRISSTLQVKLRDVAHELVETRRLPTLPREQD